MTIKLMPSLMACPTFQIKDYIDEALKLGVSHFHLDIMDGSYVPNYALSPALINDIMQLSNEIFLQVHIMSLKPRVVYENFCRNHKRIECYIHSDQEEAVKLFEYENIYPAFNLWERSLEQQSKKALAMAVPVGFCGQSRPFDLIEALESSPSLNGVTLDGGIKYEDLPLLIKYNLEAVVIGSGIFNQKESPKVMTKKIVELLSQ